MSRKGFAITDAVDEHGMPYKKIEVTDKKFFIDIKRDIGNKVYWSGDTLNSEYILLDYKEPGENNYSDGAFIIRKVGTMRAINCYLDEVILHPDNFKRTRKKKKIKKIKRKKK